jgi:hypothetical protein
MSLHTGCGVVLLQVPWVLLQVPCTLIPQVPSSKDFPAFAASKNPGVQESQEPTAAAARIYHQNSPATAPFPAHGLSTDFLKLVPFIRRIAWATVSSLNWRLQQSREFPDSAGFGCPLVLCQSLKLGFTVLKLGFTVIPAQAGIQIAALVSRLRGNDVTQKLRFDKALVSIHKNQYQAGCLQFQVCLPAF